MVNLYDQVFGLWVACRSEVGFQVYSLAFRSVAAGMQSSRMCCTWDAKLRTVSFSGHQDIASGQLVEFPVRCADLAFCVSSMHAFMPAETTLGYCGDWFSSLLRGAVASAEDWINRSWVSGVP